MTLRHDRIWQICGLVGAIACWSHPALAQVVEDNTLGAESSQVVRNVQIRGVDSDRIEGGARRGANLFHSFSQFSILQGRGAYFENPVGIQNIFSRVTGAGRSNIDGRLGVLGDANLFLINPNGIVFGRNATLDVGGSFVGTTANGLQFGDRGFFNATNPEVPSDLLTVNPSALLFGSPLVTPSQILVQGDGQGTRTSATLIDTQTGLRVPGDRTLALIGGDLVFDGATLKTAGGRIELGSVGAGSSVGITPVATGWFFGYTNVQNFRDIQLAQQSTIDASGLGGGNIQVQGRQISLTGGSQIEASTLGSQPGGNLAITASGLVDFRSAETDNFYTGLYAQVYRGATGSGGNINVTADRFNLTGNYAIASTSTYGSGRGGDLVIHANDVEVIGANQRGSSVRLEADAGGQAGGQGGNLTIDTRQLRVSQAQVSASTVGIGNAGNLTIRASDSVELSGESPGDQNGYPGGLFAIVNYEAEGQGGNLNLTTRRLSVSDGSKAQAISFGNGNSGNVVIAADRIEVFETDRANYYATGIFAGTGVDPNNVELPRGNGGSLTIRANQVSVRGGEISANASGQGNAGRLLIQARDSVEVVDTSTQTGANSSIRADVNSGATGRAGDLTIETGSLTVLGSQISASTFGVGNAGNLTIRADSVELRGENPNARNGAGIPGGVMAQVDLSGTGSGGNLVIEAGRLRISDGSKAQAISFGNGNAGNVDITADDVEIFETARPNIYSTGIFVGAGLDPTSTQLTQGGRGNLTIQANRVSIRGGRISGTTQGQGDAGNISIHARDSVEVIDTSAVTRRRSFIEANVASNATGRGGDVTIETNRLRVQGGQIIASTSGQGDAGNLTIHANNSITLVGQVPALSGVDNGLPGGLLASVQSGASGQGGNIRITTGRLNIRDGSQIQVATLGNGEAGRLSIRANEINVRETSAPNAYTTGIFAGVETESQAVNPPIGNGGDLTIRTHRLSLHGGEVSANTAGQGNAGQLRIHVRDLLEIVGTSATIGRNSFLGADVTSGATGQGGRVIVEAGRLSVRDGGRVSVRTSGAGNAGTLRVNANSVEVNGRSANGRTPSQLSAAVDRNSTGQGGNLILEADNLRLTEGGQISAQTAGQRRAGDISIQANDSIALANGSISTASTAATRRSTGRGGDITIQTGGLEASDRSRITAQSQGSGRAGNITLNASGQLNVTDSAIATSALNSSGGNITLNTESSTLLQNSNITTNSNRGNGGNITLSGNTVALDNSDLFARSRDRQGGRISLGNFFGENYQPNAAAPFDNNDRVDVNADGGGAPGEISLTDTSFIQNSLNELSVDSINTGALLANSCIVRDRQRSSFRVTGADNFPERPGNDNASPYPTGTIRSIPTDGSANPQPDRPWQIGDAIVEPQGVYRLPDGRLVMSRECSE